jgi:RNA polymerase sigma factor (sigma-70 family)
MSLPPFEQVVEKHGATVLRVCRAILGYHEAEDAWSETFLAALRAYPELDPNTNMEAWLVTVAKRKAIDQHRSAARNPVPTAELPDAATKPLALPDSYDELWTAMKELPLPQREAVAYHHVAGLPYAEIAQILGKSEAAARRASADGMKKLRASYQGASR